MFALNPAVWLMSYFVYSAPPHPPEVGDRVQAGG